MKSSGELQGDVPSTPTTTDMSLTGILLRDRTTPWLTD